MEAVGQLAGGIPHDRNHLLTVIGAAADALSADGEREEQRRASLLEIRRAVVRGAELTRQLLAFGGRQRADPRPVSVNDVVREVHPMLRRLLRAEIEVSLALTDGLSPVRADRCRLVA